MIAHQYKTVNIEVMSFLITGKYLKIFQIVFIISEYLFSPVATYYHMIERTFVLYPRFPRHVPSYNGSKVTIDYSRLSNISSAHISQFLSLTPFVGGIHNLNLDPAVIIKQVLKVFWIYLGYMSVDDAVHGGYGFSVNNYPGPA